MHDLRKAWHIGDILTVITGRIVSPLGREAYLQLMEYMADRPLTPSDRLQYGGDFAMALLAQYPELEDISANEEDMPPDELRGIWLQRRAAEFGEFLSVNRLPPDHPARTTPASSPLRSAVQAARDAGLFRNSGSQSE